MRCNQRSNDGGYTLFAQNPIRRVQRIWPARWALTLNAWARTKRRAACFGGPRTEIYEFAATSSVANPLAVTKVNATNLRDVDLNEHSPDLLSDSNIPTYIPYCSYFADGQKRIAPVEKSARPMWMPSL